mmetsp:Transcript_68156/g.109824  ORF Transcript_68156/g.109824 Transcript_68156/m.109824 type:complete len:360 (+) Transcript_68156:202-1281(+)
MYSEAKARIFAGSSWLSVELRALLGASLAISRDLHCEPDGLALQTAVLQCRWGKVLVKVHVGRLAGNADETVALVLEEGLHCASVGLAAADARLQVDGRWLAVLVDLQGETHDHARLVNIRRLEVDIGGRLSALEEPVALATDIGDDNALGTLALILATISEAALAKAALSEAFAIHSIVVVAIALAEALAEAACLEAICNLGGLEHDLLGSKLAVRHQEHLANHEFTLEIDTWIQSIKVGPVEPHLALETGADDEAVAMPLAVSLDFSSHEVALRSSDLDVGTLRSAIWSGGQVKIHGLALQEFSTDLLGISRQVASQKHDVTVDLLAGQKTVSLAAIPRLHDARVAPRHAEETRATH